MCIVERHAGDAAVAVRCIGRERDAGGGRIARTVGRCSYADAGGDVGRRRGDDDELGLVGTLTGLQGGEQARYAGPVGHGVRIRGGAVVYAGAVAGSVVAISLAAEVVLIG